MSIFVVIESSRRAAPTVRGGRVSLILAVSVTLLLLVELWGVVGT
jgi:hypothetical protein